MSNQAETRGNILDLLNIHLGVLEVTIVYTDTTSETVKLCTKKE